MFYAYIQRFDVIDTVENFLGTKLGVFTDDISSRSQKMCENTC